MATISTDPSVQAEAEAAQAHGFLADRIASTERLMRLHPVATIAIALGAGYVLGRLLARR